MNYLETFSTEKELNEYIRKRLKNIRIDKHLTQAGIAESLNMSEQNYARIERGQYNANMFLVFKLCSKLNITLEDFFQIKRDIKDTEFDVELRQFIINNKDELLKFSKFIIDYFEN